MSIGHPITEPGAGPTRKAQVLSKATVNAARHLGLPSTVLARVLGLSEASISRLRSGKFDLQPDGKPYELAQLLVRLFRGLDAITGGDDAASQSWIRGENLALRGRPIELIQTIPGLIATLAYVDSRRARI